MQAAGTCTLAGDLLIRSVKRRHQSAEPSAFGQNHPERVSFSSKQYKNTVYQNLNTMQHVGGEGRVQTRQAPTPSTAPSQDNNTTIGPLEPAKCVIT